MMHYKDIEDILSIDTVGVIPESNAVLQASNIGEPVIFNQNSDAGQAYKQTVSRLLGDNIPLQFVDKKPGLLKRIMGLKSVERV